MSYDPMCYELAEYFLNNNDGVDGTRKPIKADFNELAQRVQETVEDFLTEEREPDEDPRHDARDRDEWRHEAAEQQRLK